MLSFTKFTSLVASGLFLLLFITSSFAQSLNLQNKIVVDPLTGVALEGYDAISYFTQDQPELGRPEYELIWDNVSWYFSNEANREVFVRAPQIYMPQFGGHGTMGLSRGYVSDGNAMIYAIVGGRLFLFYSSANKDAFMLAQKSAYIRASNNWDFISRDFIPAE